MPQIPSLPTTTLSSREAPPGAGDLLCFSHLRWNFVYQRPQHLLTRFAHIRRVFFFEEPVFDAPAARLAIVKDSSGVTVLTPHLPAGLPAEEVTAALRRMVDELVSTHALQRYVLWYYTPLARRFSAHLRPSAIVYDCMDELSAFAGAPPELPAAERELFAAADVVFTGGHSLYEAKRQLHPHVYACPSSVDGAHFARARQITEDPPDQRSLARPRLGFFGVIDERLDITLLGAVAARRPEWQFVLVGPVVKIDPAVLPRGANLHYLGARSYAELPHYIAGWDVALLPFARNDATRFISPTKTPEYLAAGRPVVSTSIRDVVRPYGELGLARIADTPDAFVAAVEAALTEPAEARLAAADALLSQMSWDLTWARMARLTDEAVARRRARAATAYLPVASGVETARALLP